MNILLCKDSYLAVHYQLALYLTKLCSLIKPVTFVLVSSVQLLVIQSLYLLRSCTTPAGSASQFYCHHDYVGKHLWRLSQCFEMNKPQPYLFCSDYILMFWVFHSVSFGILMLITPLFMVCSSGSCIVSAHGIKITSAL